MHLVRGIALIYYVFSIIIFIFDFFCWFFRSGNGSDRQSASLLRKCYLWGCAARACTGYCQLAQSKSRNLLCLCRIRTMYVLFTFGLVRHISYKVERLFMEAFARLQCIAADSLVGEQLNYVSIKCCVLLYVVPS